MPGLKLDLDTLAVVSHATAPEASATNAATTRTWTCTQTTACSFCTLRGEP